MSSLSTEADIVGLKGQEESLRLEFKAGALLEKPESAWATLSKEASAFANTEGGVLVLGIKEEKLGKRRVAGDADGVSGDLTREEVQRKLEGNLFPYLSGIRVTRIPMSSLAGRAVFVLDIPAGATAYQANDGRYYGRSEFEARYLPDHEIRVRMARGRVARASLSLHLRSIKLSAEHVAELRRQYAPAIELFASDPEDAFQQYPRAFVDLASAQHAPDVLRIGATICNDGELTIRSPAVEVSVSGSSDNFGNIRRETRTSRVDLDNATIYPGDGVEVPFSEEIRCKPNQPISPGDYIVRWKVFLDNAPPCTGELDLSVFLQTEREKEAKLLKL